MNSTTITNADGSIVTVTKFHHSSAPLWAEILGPLAVVLIILGLALLFRKQKPGSSDKSL